MSGFAMTSSLPFQTPPTGVWMSHALVVGREVARAIGAGKYHGPPG